MTTIPNCNNPGLLDVVFLLDGTLPLGDFTAARKFICDIGRDLCADRSLVRFACIVYGEYSYQFDDGRKWRSDYDVIFKPFGSLVELGSFVSQMTPQSFTDHDGCDALELGLKISTELAWEACMKELILIGHSPPHPNVSERAQYRLNDRTVEELHLGNHWRREIHRLRSISQLNFSTIWIEPDSNVLPNKQQKIFAHDIWHYIGTALAIDSIEPQSRQKLVGSILNRRRNS